MGLAVRLRLIRAARRRAAAAGVRPLDRAASLRAQSCPATAAAGFTAPSALPRHTAMARTDGGGTEVVVRPLWYTQLCPGCLTERVYYGWIILIVGTMGKIMSSPGQSSCIGPTTDAITKTLEMSESTITLLYLFGTLASALSLPQMGKVLDRVRPRTFITGVTFCLAFACLFLSLIPGIVAALQPSYYAPLLRYPLLLGAFFMLRFFGQGSMMMASQTPINYWYVEQRGSRMGWAGATASLFMMGVIPPLMFHDMEQHSWEHTYRGLALIALAFAPVGWMFIRDTPETFGLLPDGRKPPDQTSSQPQDMQQQQQQQEEEDAPIVEENWTLEEARRTTVFWMTSFSIGQLSLTGTAFVFHFRAAMRDQDIPDSEVDRLYLLISIASVISRVGGGYLLDRTSERFVMVFGLAAQSISMTLMGFLTPQTARVAAFIQGASGGIMMNVTAVAYANFFGRKHLGAIQGFAQSAGVLGSALGPFPFGLTHQLFGSYKWAFIISGGVTLVNAFFSWRYMIPPVKPATRGVYDPMREHRTAGEQKGLLAAGDMDDGE